MSKTYNLVCPETKTAIWCGQRDYLYGGEKLKLFAKWLHAHEGKAVFFVNDESELLDEIEDKNWVGIDEGGPPAMIECAACDNGTRLSVGWKCDVCGRVNQSELAAPAGSALPCPFCGGVADVTRHEHGWYVICTGCKIATGGEWTRERVLALWNRRETAMGRLP